MNNEAFAPTQLETGALSVQDVAVTAGAANDALTVKGKMLRITNKGAGNVTIGFSNSPSATAITAATGMYIAAGVVMIITRPEASGRILTLGDGVSTLNVVGGLGL